MSIRVFRVNINQSINQSIRDFLRG